VEQDGFRKQIQVELDHAELSRVQGFEGRARVNARRAAGLAIQFYFERIGLSFPRISAYDLIKTLGNQPNLPEDILKITEHLTTRVDEEFNLPIQVDLLKETRWLIDQLELLPFSEHPGEGND
jgi:hypothetical protein